jgi:flagellar biosynthesis/type III secretory pathway protein FliH
VAEAFAFPELEGWRIDQPRPAKPDEAEQLAEAERRGHDEGLAAGRALAEAELEPLRIALQAATASLGAARDDVIARAEARSVELGVILAQKILAIALELEPKLLLGVVEGALRHLVDSDEVVLEVNPADVALLETELGLLDPSANGPKTITVSGERRVGRGGCVVRTREGEIDARLETQLERAAELLRGALAS